MIVIYYISHTKEISIYLKNALLKMQLLFYRNLVEIKIAYQKFFQSSIIADF
jgi:hypothetical protein